MIDDMVSLVLNPKRRSVLPPGHGEKVDEKSGIAR